MDDIFCKIIAGDIPSYKVYEDEDVIAILDIDPAVQGHTLVIPKKHYDTFATIPADDLSQIIKQVQMVACHIVNKLSANGFHIIVNNGESAGQSVSHLHFHILPRFGEEDGFAFQTKPQKVNLQEIYSKLI